MVILCVSQPRVAPPPSLKLRRTLTLGYSIQPFQGKVHKLLIWVEQVKGSIGCLLDAILAGGEVVADEVAVSDDPHEDIAALLGVLVEQRAEVLDVGDAEGADADDDVALA